MALRLMGIFAHPDDGAKYTEVVDEKRRLIYRSAFDPTEFKKAREELERRHMRSAPGGLMHLQDRLDEQVP